MSAYQCLFDPPSQDDLDYLPDPLGRLGMGSYVEKPQTMPDPGWEAARDDWMNGAPLGQIFGDGIFDLQDGVGADQANRRGDVFKLQALLHREGYLDAAATEGPTGFWGGRDDYALRKFQKENGLNIDGFAAPGGETIETIRGFYGPQPAPGIRTPDIQTGEKRGDDPEPIMQPIGLGGDRPLKPVLLSSDPVRSDFTEATGFQPGQENAPARPAGEHYAQAADVASDAVPAAKPSLQQNWLVNERGLASIRDIAAKNAALPKAERAQSGIYLYPGKTESQECVALVQAVVPEINMTKTWQPGTAIRGDGDPPLQPGTAIATFKDGTYKNQSGYHAAIFLGYGKDPAGRDGIVVIDQWNGHPAEQRVIPFNPKASSASNNTGAFSVIQSPIQSPPVWRPK